MSAVEATPTLMVTRRVHVDISKTPWKCGHAAALPIELRPLCYIPELPSQILRLRSSNSIVLPQRFMQPSRGLAEHSINSEVTVCVINILKSVNIYRDQCERRRAHSGQLTSAVISGRTCQRVISGF